MIGIDEAGRGPLCGPVVAAACLVPDDVDIDGIVDSKKLTDESQREHVYSLLTSDKRVMWFASACSPAEIDELNILQASLKAMRDACQGLIDKYRLDTSSHIALVDGNKVPTDMPVPVKYVIKGDSIIFSIAAASIIAKVTRDRTMHELHEKYPLYGLARHKGYPTLEHRTTIYNLGLPSTAGEPSIYRFSYRPVQEAHQRQLLAVGKGTSKGNENNNEKKKETTKRGTTGSKQATTTSATTITTTATTKRKVAAKSSKKSISKPVHKSAVAAGSGSRTSTRVSRSAGSGSGSNSRSSITKGLSKTPSASATASKALTTTEAKTVKATASTTKATATKAERYPKEVSQKVSTKASKVVEKRPSVATRAIAKTETTIKKVSLAAKEAGKVTISVKAKQPGAPTPSARKITSKTSSAAAASTPALVRASIRSKKPPPLPSPKAAVKDNKTKVKAKPGKSSRQINTTATAKVVRVAKRAVGKPASR